MKQSASLCNSWYVSSREKSSIRSGKITKNTQIISNTVCVCVCVPYLIFLKQSVDIREGNVWDAGVTKAFSTRKLLPTQRLDKREGPLNTEDLLWIENQPLKPRLGATLNYLAVKKILDSLYCIVRHIIPRWHIGKRQLKAYNNCQPSTVGIWFNLWFPFPKKSSPTFNFWFCYVSLCF